MTTNLKPCPFCGSPNPAILPRTCNRSTPYNPMDRAFPEVRCRGCHASVPGADWGEPQSAIDAWNARESHSARDGSIANHEHEWRDTNSAKVRVCAKCGATETVHRALPSRCKDCGADVEPEFPDEPPPTCCKRCNEAQSGEPL